MQTVLVTGAAGTVGSCVVRLAEASGYRVIATDKVSTGLQRPVRGEVRIGDLRNVSFIHTVLKDCDHVIHTAADLRLNADATELAHINSQAVANLFEAAAETKVKRFVHVSTAMLYDEKAQGPLTESTALAPRGVFGLSKQGAEMYLRASTGVDVPAWTIVRSAPLYGPRGRHISASLLVLGPMLKLLLPRLPVLRGGPCANLVHAEDVASSLIFCLQNDVTAHQVVNVADEDPMPLGQRWTETFRAYGLRTLSSVDLKPRTMALIRKVFEVPTGHKALDLSSASAWRLVVLRHRLKPVLRPVLDPEGLTLLEHDWVIDTSRLRGWGWTPRFPRFVEGWRDVLKWYQAERWVPIYNS